MPQLVADVADLIRAQGVERADIVGHDWGAALAWQFAQSHPELVRRLAILNVPHPQRMQQGLLSPRQALKSWYMFFFQLPWLPEWWLRRRDFASIRRLFAADGFTPDVIERYVTAARSGNAVRNGINYYRAAFRDALLGRAPHLARIDCPTLVIWGERDRFLGRELAAPPPEWVPHARVEFIPDATHWVQQAAPARVNELLLEFLTTSALD